MYYNITQAGKEDGSSSDFDFLEGEKINWLDVTDSDAAGIIGMHSIAS